MFIIHIYVRILYTMFETDMTTLSNSELRTRIENNFIRKFKQMKY